MGVQIEPDHPYEPPSFTKKWKKLTQDPRPLTERSKNQSFSKYPFKHTYPLLDTVWENIKPHLLVINEGRKHLAAEFGTRSDIDEDYSYFDDSDEGAEDSEGGNSYFDDDEGSVDPEFDVQAGFMDLPQGEAYYVFMTTAIGGS